MTQDITAIIAASVSIVTLIWFTALYVGRITIRMERVEQKVDRHEKLLDKYLNFEER